MFSPVFVCLSVCLLPRLLKNACMGLDMKCCVSNRCRDMDELINCTIRIVVRIHELDFRRILEF